MTNTCALQVRVSIIHNSYDAQTPWFFIASRHGQLTPGTSAARHAEERDTHKQRSPYLTASSENTVLTQRHGRVAVQGQAGAVHGAPVDALTGTLCVKRMIKEEVSVS